MATKAIMEPKPLDVLRASVAPPANNLPRIYPLPYQHVDIVDPALMIPEAALTDPFGAGQHAWEIASALPMTEGAMSGRLFGEVATEWQKRLIIALHGHRDADGNRIFRRLFLRTARKSGKTTLIAILAVLEALLDEEGRGQIACLASNRDQAKLCFGHISAMIRKEPELERMFRIAEYAHRATPTDPDGATIKAFASESGASLVGLHCSMAIFDELHAIGSALGERGKDIVHAIESGMVSRSNPLICYITTAPIRTRAGVYDEISGHAEKVFSGVYDDRRTLVLDFRIPAGLDYNDPANWHYSNPCLGTTLTLDALKERHDVAQARGGDALAEFLSQNLNVEPEERKEADASGFDLPRWRELADPALANLDAFLARYPTIVAGIDAGGARDMTCLVLLGIPNSETEPMGVHAHAWLTHDGFNRIKNNTPAGDFVAAGELTLIDRVGEDVQDVMRIVDDLAADSRLACVGLDPWGLESIFDDLTAKGISVEGVPQGARARPFIHALERDIANGSLTHDGSRLMDWCLGNTRFKEMGRGLALVKIDEKHDSHNKIDGAVALLCAHAVRGTKAFDVGSFIC